MIIISLDDNGLLDILSNVDYQFIIMMAIVIWAEDIVVFCLLFSYVCMESSWYMQKHKIPDVDFKP